MRLNPHYPDWYGQAAARSLYLLGRHENARPYLTKITSTGSHFIAVRFLAAAYQGHLETDRESRLLATSRSFGSLRLRPL